VLSQQTDMSGIRYQDPAQGHLDPQEGPPWARGGGSHARYLSRRSRHARRGHRGSRL